MITHSYGNQQSSSFMRDHTIKQFGGMNASKCSDVETISLRDPAIALHQRAPKGEAFISGTYRKNLDAILTGADITKVEFPKKYVKAFFVKSLIYKTLSFPSNRCKSRGNGTVYVMRYK